MNQSEICSWFETLNKHMLKTRHRTLVLLQGDNSWGKLTSTAVIKHFRNLTKNTKPLNIKVWGDDFLDEINKGDCQVVKNYRHHLGSENDLVIFADNDFHPDAFAALSGTLISGGILIWIISPEEVQNDDDLFIQRLWRKAQRSHDIYTLSQSDNYLPNIDQVENLTENDSTVGSKEFVELESGCKTYEQLSAVTAINKVASGHRKRPLILTADRGRGKSSALAIAVAKRLLSTTVTELQKILITAPHIDALSIFFAQLKFSCPDGEFKNNTFSFHGHYVEFIAVDVLLRDKPAAHLLLVDEAATIPVYILSQLVDVYHRIVFSSTQHGYEGAGRGFAIKFKQVLKEKTPDFNQLHIHQPIRWTEGDPLENYVFESFLLNCKNALLVNHESDEKSLDKIAFREVNRKELFDNEKLLQQVFTVLVTAHYQTSPSDLKLLLNNQAVRLFIIEASSLVVAVALTMKEGEALEHQIVDMTQAKSRLKNQFLPQSLFLHNHCLTAFEYQYLRVMRIAVLPNFQQKGVGLLLLDKVKGYALENNIDMLGTSFGANDSLLNFWHKADYKNIRLGFTTDKASGEHSTVYLFPLSAPAVNLVDDLQTQFYNSFIYLLTEHFQNVSTRVIANIIKQWPVEKLPELTCFDELVVVDFKNKKSLLGNCIYSLHLKLIHQLAMNPEAFQNTSMVKEVLIKRILQKQEPASICSEYALTGKKQLNQMIIDGFNLCNS